MNSMDHYLLRTERESGEKVAFDQSIRNFGVDMLGYGGKALRNFEKNPLVSGAVLGAGMGGVEGAMTADRHGESKTRRGLRHALYGGLGGAAASGLFSGATRGIGRYGKDIEEHAKSVRGHAGLKDAERGQFAEIMRDTVFNPDSYRGGKELANKRKIHDIAEAAAARTGSKAHAKAVADARKALNEAGGGYGTRFRPTTAAGMVAAGAGAGVIAGKAREKNASARLRGVVEHLHKEANFGALAAKAVGYGAQGAGKAIQMGAANPALAGAAVGAAGGAIAGGEGNRLKGALGGAALGAGAGAGLAKLAPQATANMGQFGKSLSTTGKLNVRAANKNLAAIKGGADPSTLKKLPGYGNMGNVNANFAKNNRVYDIATRQGTSGVGMSGGAAAGTALAGVGAAGLAGGAATSAMFGSDSKGSVR